jgi:hypothetical protein
MSESEGTRSQSDSGDQEGRGGSESRDTLREGPDSHNSSEESDRQDHELGRAEEDRRGDRETFEAKQHQGDASRDGHDRRDVSMFFSDLQGHGSWLKRGDFDYVFVPQVESGWRPYVRGHWVWTDEYGWYWASNEPFAWAVYHYGRWGYDPDIGWFWVPGNVWAPAWVTWRRGGGHVGWAPIAPRGRGYALGYADYYEPPIVEAWVFVPEKRFVAVDIVSYVEPVVEVNTILRESREGCFAENT